MLGRFFIFFYCEVSKCYNVRRKCDSDVPSYIYLRYMYITCHYHVLFLSNNFTRFFFFKLIYLNEVKERKKEGKYYVDKIRASLIMIIYTCMIFKFDLNRKYIFYKDLLY